jgi:hypothetical protein
MSAGSIIRGVWTAIKPPARRPDEPQETYDWRVGITSIQLLTVLLLMMHILFAAGLTISGLFSLPGYVYASDFVEFKDSLNDRSTELDVTLNAINFDLKSSLRSSMSIRIDLLQDRICAARAVDNAEAERSGLILMQSFQNRYAEVSHGERYDLLPCL